MDEARFRSGDAVFEVSSRPTPEGRWKAVIRQEASFGPHVEYTMEVPPDEHATAHEALQAGTARVKALFPDAERSDP